eukprot:CAMPEP_0184644206 /NCGR_PEP_ID=MMETSP0308-20130426/970_1 /TAXON_ID=38269 /ORGANISM="Gloeochaete witrockiana, Strain SAG 46.84" /LENGTH=100 /DNA_ID=CAMNT_0027072615 /DNA_START=147 /DNA_END=449 /DNA_ORIENTATION=+
MSKVAQNTGFESDGLSRTTTKKASFSLLKIRSSPQFEREEVELSSMSSMTCSKPNGSFEGYCDEPEMLETISLDQVAPPSEKENVKPSLLSSLRMKFRGK